MTSTVTTGRNQHIKVILTGPGSLTMSAKAVAAPTVTWGKTVTVTGTPPAVEPTGVALSPAVPAGNVDFTAHSSFQVNASIQPTGANRDTTLTWASSDTTVATVSGTGLVTLTGKAGSFSISVSTGNGKTAALSYTTAGKPKPVVVKPTGVTISGVPTSVNLKRDSSNNPIPQSFNLTATVLPDNATDKSVTWSLTGGLSMHGGPMSDAEMAQHATISSDGVLTVRQPCFLQVHVHCNAATNIEGASNAITVTADPVLPTSVQISGLPATIDMSKTRNVTLYETVMPNDAADKSVQWSVTGPAEIYYANSGVILTLTGAGTVTVSVACVADKNVTATATATVTGIMPTSITISGLPKTITIEPGKTLTYQLSANVLPADATDKRVTWSVSAGGGSN